MKKILGILLLFVILITATAITSNEPESMHTIEGTWELQNFYNYDGENVIDTVELPKGYRQVKMYYNGRIMWSRTTQQQTNEPDGNDVVGRFGFGTYKITDTELIENIEYGDAGMMAALDTMRTFTFELVLKDDTYSQISTDEDGNRTFSENYLRID